LQGSTPKEIHAILTETLACFVSGRDKDLSAPLYIFRVPSMFNMSCMSNSPRMDHVNAVTLRMNLQMTKLHIL